MRSADPSLALDRHAGGPAAGAQPGSQRLAPDRPRALRFLRRRRGAGSRPRAVPAVLEFVGPGRHRPRDRAEDAGRRVDRALATPLRAAAPAGAGGAAQRNSDWPAARRGGRDRNRVGRETPSSLMNTRLPAVIAVGLAWLVATPARAQGEGDRWERQVRAQLERATASLGTRGAVRSFAPRVGTLDTDESESFTLTLQAGVSYTVVGTCDEDCERLGLVLSDLSSHDLAADRASENAPVVQLTPRQTASYRVQVVMERCRVNPCRYGVALITLPAP